MAYLGEDKCFIESVDPDIMSYDDIQDMADQLGYGVITQVFYTVPYLEGNQKFREIKCDLDVLRMFYAYEAQGETNSITLYIVAPFLNMQGYEVPIDIAEKEDLTDNFEQLESNYAPSDELISLCSSDDEDSGPMQQEYMPSRDLGVKELELGMKFGTAVDFRLTVRETALKKRFDVKFIKNDGDRVNVVCKNDCGWKIYASKPEDDDCLIVKTYVSEHTNCLWFQTNSQASSSYLANKYLEQLRSNPKMPLQTLKSTIACELNIDVSEHKVKRAKRKALKVIEGDEVEQYGKMREYSMKNGFKEGCRPLIGVDECFLKGPYGGHILSAISIDGNNQMFPVAFAVVESETRDSWSWFMTELMDAVGPYEDITFISDRQKGLVDTFENIMVGSKHRYCVRHLYENFKLRFKGQQLKIELWEAARSCTEADFNAHMRKIHELNVEAYRWLHNVPSELWSKSGFSYQSKSDMVINNMCESWNAVILKARDKPIMYMLEWIRRHLMLRFQQKR
ncbi:uncharacterized protein LOC132274437 [Cornus florida]|uniref:uncharacterized protein LOC132274437 n=1 Tax=Cornus florida TaxID=4283 RepID=UPI00289BCBDC|nr:uncharacterized protein LOC132274437 [Cornus florida]